ncbi:hypothetical protein RCL1_006104 [Eukaryota sp. TZLM3-RCL]
MDSSITFQPISSPEPIFDVKCHPNQNVLAMGVYGGIVRLYRYNPDPGQNQLLANLKPHKKSVTCMDFSSQGDVLFTGSRDKAIKAIALQEEKVLWKRVDAHGCHVSAIKFLPYTAHSFGNADLHTMLASGDESGTIKIWDSRAPKCVKVFNDGADYISSFVWNPKTYTLLAGCGDGSLYSYDFRTNSTTFTTVSEDFQDELLSLALVKSGKKLLAGTMSGNILIFDWDFFGDCCDRLVGHPEAVESMISIDEDTILTASDDGIIRVVSVLPNKLLGVIGEHGQFPIEQMSLSFDKSVLASCSHDNTVKLWDLSIFNGEDEETNGGEEKEEGFFSEMM